MNRLTYRAACGIIALVAYTAINAAQPDPPEEPEGDDLTFVYIHGFGGLKEDPEFCQKLREFIGERRVDARVINYEWDSVKVSPLRAGASWKTSQQRADKEAKRFKSEVLDKLEKAKTPYIIVGFSVGTRVVLGALEQTTAKLKSLEGIYFLGSALTNDATLENRETLPAGMKIVNYHSPSHDIVHRAAFEFMSPIPAGGRVGFSDRTLFENLPVSCSHAHKGVGIHIDYSSLAEAIAEIELYQTGARRPGETKFNWKTRVGDGGVWWNRVAKVRASHDSSPVEVEIEQHNVRHGYFRALLVDKKGGRTRIARGEDLGAILTEINAEFEG
jgi:hypothetical protein